MAMADYEMEPTRFPAHERLVACRRRVRQIRARAGTALVQIVEIKCLAAASGGSTLAQAVVRPARNEVIKA